MGGTDGHRDYRNLLPLDEMLYALEQRDQSSIVMTTSWSLHDASAAALNLLAEQHYIPRMLSRCCIYRAGTAPDKRYRGRLAGKRRFFYGVRVHMLTTAAGAPVD